MRLSQLFFSTLRDDPADVEMASHRLLLRAGYIRPLGSGIYSLLPLGKRVNDRVEQVIREEQDRIRRWRCRSFIPPTSGARAAGTTQSARS
jgi:prolyl-tRNA synthetase